MSLTQINKAGLDEIALDHVFTISHSGTSAYTFQGEGLNGTVSNPTLYLTRGKTYRFENVTGAHAIRIQSADNGTNGTLYNTGVTNNNSTGTVIVEVQHDAPDVLYYQCAVHASMKGTLYITGALADGGVTTAKIADNAVTTAKIADTAITGAKIAANTIGNTKIIAGNIVTSKIADSAVTTAKIADDAVDHTKLATGAANTAAIGNGAVTAAKLDNNAVTTAKIADGNVTAAKLASGVQTTINNNADNRVITGSGTANTLNAESGVIIDANGNVGIGVSSTTNRFHVEGTTSGSRFGVDTSSSGITALATTNETNADLEHVIYDGRSSFGSSVNVPVCFHTNGKANEKLRFDGTGRFGIGHNLNGASDYNRLVVHNPHSGSCWMQLTSTASGNGINTDGLAIGMNTANTGHIWLRENADLAFATNGTKRMSILAGGGLAFNNDTAQANALDDYEEGTWTPAISFGYNTYNQSYGHQQGQYTKIGNRVFCTCYVYFTNKGTATGVARVGGLPFTNANVSVNYAVGAVWINGWNGGATVPTGYVQVNTTHFRIERQRCDNPSSSFGVSICDNTNFNNNTDLMLNLHYRV